MPHSQGTRLPPIPDLHRQAPTVGRQRRGSFGPGYIHRTGGRCWRQGDRAVALQLLRHQEKLHLRPKNPELTTPDRVGGGIGVHCRMDPITDGNPIGWTIRTLGEKLPKMLDRAGYKEIAAATDPPRCGASCPRWRPAPEKRSYRSGTRSNTTVARTSSKPATSGSAVRCGGSGTVTVASRSTSLATWAGRKGSHTWKKRSFWRSTVSGRARITIMVRATKTTG